jgi:hypothetical protein
MGTVTLNTKEKQRFVEWLRHDAAEKRLLAREMQPPSVQWQIIADAEELVANVLEQDPNI